MKKLFLISLSLSIMFLLIISCTSEINEEILNENISTNTEDWDHIPLSNAEPSKQFGNYNALGFGYDVTGAYANENATTLQVIDVIKLIAENNQFFTETNVLSNELKETYGRDATIYSKIISNRVATTEPFQLFGKTIPFSSAIFNNKKYDPSFIYGDISQMIIHKRFRLLAYSPFLKNYLTSSFSQDVEDKTAEQIVQKYGTHVAVDIYTGTIMNIYFQAKTTNPDRDYAASIGVKTFSQGNANPLDVEAAKKNYEKKIFYKTRGGDKNLAMSGIYNIRSGAPKINFSDWQSTSSAANSVLVDFADNGLIVLYDLIENPSKKAELKMYIDQYINDNQVSF